ITVEFCRNVAECTTVHVEPHTEDDWEILELHAGYVEENLLSQLRVVYPGQLFCVWIHGKTLVRLRVGELDPKQGYLKLNTNSEVIVAPKVRKQPKPAADVAASLMRQQQLATHICLRNLPDTILPNLSPRNVYIHPDSAGDLAGSELVRVSKVTPAFVRKGQEDDKDQNMDPELEDAKALFVPLVLSKEVPRDHVLLDQTSRNTLDTKEFDIIKVATVTMKKSQLGSIILRRYVSSTQSAAPQIRLGLDAQNQAQEKAEKDKVLIEAFKAWLASEEDHDVLLTRNSRVIFDVGEESVQCLVQFGQKKGLFASLNGAQQPPQDLTADQYVAVSSAQVKGLQVDIGEEIARTPDEKKKSSDKLPLLGGVKKTFEKVHSYTTANLAKKELKDALAVPGSGGILVTGSHGAGKTSLVRKLIRDLHDDPSALIFAREVNCAEVADERVPTFKDLLQRWFDEAAWHAPSILFFDDIDRLVPAEVEHADSSRSRHLAELFLRTASIMTQRHPIMLIATSQQQQSLHPSLISNHIFTELRHINPPSRDERKEIMEAIMSDGPDVLVESLPRIDLVSVASETEGYLAADLKALIERAVHEGTVRSIKTAEDDNAKLQLMQEDFGKAQQDFVPSSLRGVKLQSSGVQWSDIGGLTETRKTLLETLEWPTKYSVVFSQCPLRLRSGVKGPEILNKYIGASEKSVRDLFERAQAAKPCVLFFDEFDSIAPRRGHDSTGVTDRVVNQMLTQMDGAEGLDGVYVLAATSRPDLIDPALLRPGRLDKALLCGMPNFEERLEILQALSNKMTLASEVDLQVFAGKTEGYSGADLQGFLYNAHLEAIHGAINIDSFREQQKRENEVSKEEVKSDFVMARTSESGVPLTLAEKGQISQRLALIKTSVNVQRQKQQRGPHKEDAATVAANAHAAAAITNAHLEKSLKSTRASITAEEYLRLSMIYNEFVTGRTGELPSGEGAKGIGERSTLG
ncbi:P-loop containing nucleoside triphosphate hydrolase protein, partial [Syncephalastrum racemosum]